MENLSMNAFGKTRRDFLKTAGLGAAFLAGANRAVAKPEKMPNILWISTEDISANLRCYGDENAVTPILDALAQDGMLFSNTFFHAGVCAPVRSGIITGMYPTSIGTQHMRSGGSGLDRSLKPDLSPRLRCFPEYLRDAGYYCANNSKEDYQFVTPASPWDDSSGSAHWRNKKPGQPFFFVRNFGVTHEGKLTADQKKHMGLTPDVKPEQRQDRAKQKFPPYYPDTPLIRDTWARYLELITQMDYDAGELLKQLEEDGLADDTIVFFWSDHGVGLPRAKRWLYDSGSHVPLIVRIPEKFRVNGQGVPGTVDDRLTSSVDFAPTVLNLAGIDIPGHFQGQPFLGRALPAERTYVYGARDRMDERYDIIRAVRDKRYRYIRNYEPFKPYYQYMNTAEKSVIMKELRRLYAEGQLPPEAELFMAETKPVEELYDLKEDPHEVRNLAGSSAHREILERMRAAQVKWASETKDLGMLPEPEILRRAAKLGGDRYAIFQKPGSGEYMERLVAVAALAGVPKKRDKKKLDKALKDEDAAIRYWAAVGLGNLGTKAASSSATLGKALKDEVPVVRISAGRALCLMDKEDDALPTLIDDLGSKHEWVRLHAAIVLDTIGDKARPAIPALKEALKDRENKYVVRVVNHALNVMLGTNNTAR